MESESLRKSTRVNLCESALGAMRPVRSQERREGGGSRRVRGDGEMDWREVMRAPGRASTGPWRRGGWVSGRGRGVVPWLSRGSGVGGFETLGTNDLNPAPGGGGRVGGVGGISGSVGGGD